MSDQSPSEVAGEGQGTTVTVSRVVPHPVKDVWKVLLTDDGTEALLGAGGKLGDKGHTWQAEDGSHGVTRSFHPMEQIRFSWHADADAPPTMVDVHLSPEGDDATRLEVVHSKLAGDVDEQALTDHWNSSLERIEADAL